MNMAAAAGEFFIGSGDVMPCVMRNGCHLLVFCWLLMDAASWRLLA
jgi:hypothetical protein